MLLLQKDEYNTNCPGSYDLSTVAVLLILVCLAYSPLFIFLAKILSPIFQRTVAWFKRPNIQQIKDEEARQLEYDRKLKRLSDEPDEKRKGKRKQKIQIMLMDGSLGKLNKTVDDILLASEEVLGYRWASGSVVRDMIGEGLCMEKIIKGKCEADELILTEVSIKSGIDINLLKRIVENLEGLDSDEPARPVYIQNVHGVGYRMAKPRSISPA